MSAFRNRGLAFVWSSFVSIWEGEEFLQYLHRRGYRSRAGWPFFRRAFLECWVQEGFHRFWRIWNPGLGFLLFRFYRALGGNRGGPAAKVLAFLASGVAHNLLVLPFLGWSFTLPVAFIGFGLLVTIGPYLSRVLVQRRWPKILNVVVNVGHVLACFAIGFRLDAAIRGGFG